MKVNDYLVKRICFLLGVPLIIGLLLSVFTIDTKVNPIYSIILFVCMVLLIYTLGFEEYWKEEPSGIARFINLTSVLAGIFSMPLAIIEGFDVWFSFLTFCFVGITVVVILRYLSRFLGFLYKRKAKNWVQPIKKEVSRWIP